MHRREAAVCRATTCSTTTHICVQQAKKMMIGDEAEPIVEFPTRNQESINQRTFVERLLGQWSSTKLPHLLWLIVDKKTLNQENLLEWVWAECKLPVEGTISSFFDIFNAN